MAEGECKKCNKAFREPTNRLGEELKMQCIVCHCIVHYECTGLPRNAGSHLVKSNSLCWFCDNCRDKRDTFMVLMNRIVSLEDQLNLFNKKYDEQNAIIEKLKESVEVLCNKSESTPLPVKRSFADMAVLSGGYANETPKRPRRNDQKNP